MTILRRLRLNQANSRVTVMREGDEEGFRVRAERSAIATIFVPVWLVFWSQAGLDALRIDVAWPTILMTVWLIGWTWGMLAGTILIAWMLWGQETLSVINGDLRVCDRIWPWFRCRVYEGSLISALRPATLGSCGTLLDAPMLDGDRAAIAFRYRGRDRTLWTRVTVKDARALVAALGSRLPAEAIGAS